MNERFPIERQIRTRRGLGYVSRLYRDLINGQDTTSTIFKAGVIFILGVGFVTGYAVPVIVAGVVGAVLYSLSAMKDEYDKNEEEDQALAKLDALKLENEHLLKVLDEQFTRDHHLAHNNKFFTNRRESQQIEELKDLNDLENGALLKLTLHNYLKKLGLLDVSDDEFMAELNRKRKANGSLPSQEGIISLIESVTGFPRKHPSFASVVEKYLGDQHVPGLTLNANFSKRVTRALQLNNAQPKKEINLNPETRQKTVWDHLSRIGKNVLFWIAKCNQAYGLVLIGGVLFGVFSAGAVVAWPFLVGGAILAIGAGTAAVIYGRYVAKKYKKNTENIEKQQYYQTTRYALSLDLDLFLF